MGNSNDHPLGRSREPPDLCHSQPLRTRLLLPHVSGRECNDLNRLRFPHDLHVQVVLLRDRLQLAALRIRGAVDSASAGLHTDPLECGQDPGSGRHPDRPRRDQSHKRGLRSRRCADLDGGRAGQTYARPDAFHGLRGNHRVEYQHADLVDLSVGGRDGGLHYHSHFRSIFRPFVQLLLEPRGKDYQERGRPGFNEGVRPVLDDWDYLFVHVVAKLQCCTRS